MITRTDNGFRLEGPVTMNNVTELLQQSGALFDHGEVTVDFSGVHEVDSAAVSLMLSWQREGAARGQQFRFVNLPENLKSLAAVYGVLELIQRS